MIRPCRKRDIDPKRALSSQKVCLYSRHTGKLLGRHPTSTSALRQERAIQIRKRGG